MFEFKCQNESCKHDYSKKVGSNLTKKDATLFCEKCGTNLLTKDVKKAITLLLKYKYIHHPDYEYIIGIDPYRSVGKKGSTKMQLVRDRADVICEYLGIPFLKCQKYKFPKKEE